MFLLVVTFIGHAQTRDSLALTPPMGWNTYNTFAGNFNEKLIRDMVDLLVSTGMKDAGYTYVIIDDNWTGPRDSLGFLTVDRSRFPAGLAPLSEYIHAKGLKLGLYSDAGYKTCGGYNASRGHEFQDALLFARLGADYLKYDWCNTDNINAIGAYTTMRDALIATRRPMVFSMCEWGNNKPWVWGKGIGNLWRTTGDITACWDCIDDHGGQYSSYGVMKILDMQDTLRAYAGPGHWNDPDMLEVGNGSLTEIESRAHFSIWCMLAAPLIAGNDLRTMSKSTLDILTNKEVVAIDQDSLGVQGFKQSTPDSIQTWYKPLKGGNWAVCFFNRGSKSATLKHDWKNNVIHDAVAIVDLNCGQHVYRIRNLWTKKELGSTATVLEATLSSHDVLMLRLQK